MSVSQTGVPHPGVRIFLTMKAVYVSSLLKGLLCDSLPHPSSTLSLLTGTFATDLEYTGSSNSCTRHIGKGKVQCTLVQALRLCTGRTTLWGSRGIALPFLDHGTGRGWGVSVTPRPLFIPGKDPVPIIQEAGWAPGPVWTGAENLAPTGIRSLDRPARSQSLYRLSYPSPHQAYTTRRNCMLCAAVCQW